MDILFINSEHFWLNGWLNTPTGIKYAMDTLKGFGINVNCEEIRSSEALESLLGRLPYQTLLWPNAYYTRNALGEVVWLQEYIEERGLPYVGTPVQGLKNMLHKNLTHQLLQAADIPVPAHLTISRHRLTQIDRLIEKSALQWPIVIKPSSESCSMGILKAENLDEAKEHITQLFHDFPNSDALLETFLPSEDVTCGYLAMGDQQLLLPTYYQSLEVSGNTHVVERDIGTGPWGGSSIIMPPVKDTLVLEQLQDQMPKLAAAVGITGVTRVDARMDEDGTLKFFDVNGMPALSYPRSVLVRQVRECFPELPDHSAYEYLLRTIVIIAADRFELSIPNSVCDQNLFSLESPLMTTLNVSHSI
ncbi:MAG: hypothetical protein R8G66_10650 [Cytophagales bacterium]|nr:hypothetical protein [Cytophagales bacterium]